MRHYLLSVHNSFRALKGTVGLLFHRLNISFPRLVGGLVVFLGSSALAGWSYYTFAAPQSSFEQDRGKQATSSAPAQTAIDAQTTNETESDHATSTHDTRLSVNGETVPVPTDGSVHKEITTENGTTTVDVSSHAASSGTSHSIYKMQLEVNAHTDSRSAP